MFSARFETDKKAIQDRVKRGHYRRKRVRTERIEIIWVTKFITGFSAA